MRDILAIDIGTSVFKAGVFAPDLSVRGMVSRSYEVNIYDQVKADIDPERWWRALKEACAELRSLLPAVGVVSLSVTTPGLVPMAGDGSALGPAILFFDGRSHRQAKEIRERVGEEVFLRDACNLPVSGGSSLCSIMWIRENQPEIWKDTAMFGHCNTYIVKRMTGLWSVDPSTASITGMYNTARDDLTWNEEVLRAAGIPLTRLPPLFRSKKPVGTVLPEIALELGFSKGVAVLCGGNDAVLGALSCGMTTPGDVVAMHGTCDITCVCVDTPIASRNFNVRCHVLPNRWMTFLFLMREERPSNGFGLSSVKRCHVTTSSRNMSLGFSLPSLRVLRLTGSTGSCRNSCRIY